MLLLIMVVSVVGRLRENIQAWREIGTNDEVLEWISEGVKLPFQSLPERYEHFNHKLNIAQVKFVDSEVNKLLKTGDISRSQEKPFCINSLGCVPKKNKSYRLIVDLRSLNQNISVLYLKNEGIDVVCDLLQPNDEFISTDLKDGFHHISVHPEFRKYLGFQWKKTVLCI